MADNGETQAQRFVSKAKDITDDELRNVPLSKCYFVTGSP